VTRLHDPERCPRCQQKGRVIESKVRRRGYRRRVHRCAACKVRWRSYQTVIDPRRLFAA
jgi:hypothetical protein